MTDAPLVLVTGAAGFVGAATVRRLLDVGARVVGVDDLSAGDTARLEDLPRERFTLHHADCRDAALLDRLLARRPAAVLHLAGRVGVRRVLADPELCERENLSVGEALGDALVRAARDGVVPAVAAASTGFERWDPKAYAPRSRASRARRRINFCAAAVGSTRNGIPTQASSAQTGSTLIATASRTKRPMTSRPAPMSSARQIWLAEPTSPCTRWIR